MVYCLTRTRQVEGREVFSLFPWQDVLIGEEMEGVPGVSILNASALSFSITPDAPPESLRALLESIVTPEKPVVYVVTSIPPPWSIVVEEYK